LSNEFDFFHFHFSRSVGYHFSLHTAARTDCISVHHALPFATTLNTDASSMHCRQTGLEYELIKFAWK
jgi:hypothetical protein